ncbi:MAG TPA: signal recognition particle protein [Candidatus Marinimicrobia bacterium]|nr:signal recognition particle protein [Candidatus Neomarinimicrobiota bacterium]
MFGQITERFDSIFRRVRGLGKITDKNINDTARDIRRALLESDVHFKVAKELVNRVKDKAQGTKVLKSVKPGQQFIKIIHEELIDLLGRDPVPLLFKGQPSIIMLAGLQGSGKTTTAAKLAYSLKSTGKSVMLVAADIYRSAAVKQLQELGRQIDVPVYQDGSKDPVSICRDSIDEAVSLESDIVILDTAGRLHVDGEMMVEIQKISDAVQPTEILFVADGMTGQDAVTSAMTFHEALPLTGVILTKMDGDARGGAAVSIRKITGKPIKFIGVSEKMDGLEPFDPKRIADRILGFGDVVTLVEKAQKVADSEDIRTFQEKLVKNKFDLDDFKFQLRQLRKMGSISQLLGMMPGLNKKALKQLNMDDRQLDWTEAIINSMTLAERQCPEIINGSRRARIAHGSGRPVQEINSLLKQFAGMRKLMKQVGKKKQIQFPGMGAFGNMN